MQKIKMSLTDRIVEAVSALALVVSIVTSATAYLNLPEDIPTHYNLAGEVDGWGSKTTLWIIIAVNIVMYIVMYIVMTFLQTKPQIFNFPVSITDENRYRLYALGIKAIRWTKLSLIVMFSYLNYNTIEVANGRMSGLSEWYVPISMGFMSFIIIYYIRKMYALK